MADYHALAPELILAGTALAVLIADLFLPKSMRRIGAAIGLAGLTATALPLITLALDGATRSMFSGSYVVDGFALALKGFFVLVGYVILLMSVNYLESDRYYQGEYYFLLLSSLLGGLVMASSRDLLTIFVGLELVSAPAFLLAGWRKADSRSNEAALKFFIFGVLSAAVLLYGMSLIYGTVGSILFSEIRADSAALIDEPAFVVGVVLMMVGFGFKVAAVPFHFWAPDTYEGSPTPVTAYLSVGSKAAGFVGMLLITYLALGEAREIWGPLTWALSAVSLVVGNLVALRQENIVRMLAYSSIAHAGFMLAPFGVAGVVAGRDLDEAFRATVIYLLLYGLMNLGAFAVVIAGAQRTGTGSISGWAGLGSYDPRLGVLLTVFFFSLAGIPPLSGWFAKFIMFRGILSGSSSPWAIVLAALAAATAVIALFYYAKVVKSVWMDPVPDSAPTDDRRTRPLAPALGLALGLTALGTVVLGILPQLVADFADASKFASGG